MDYTGQTVLYKGSSWNCELHNLITNELYITRGFASKIISINDIKTPTKKVTKTLLKGDPYEKVNRAKEWQHKKACGRLYACQVGQREMTLGEYCEMKMLKK